VSRSDPHADIIRNGREVAYGHKLNLTTGRSGRILDLNPADSERLPTAAMPAATLAARCFCSHMQRAIRSRLCGVVEAFLGMFIRVSGSGLMGRATASLLPPLRMNNLQSNHS
jgi:hypothetical protein